MAALIALLLVGCGSGGNRPEALRPASDLAGACYDASNPKEHARVGTKLEAGQSAVDFSLKTADGTKVTLASLLSDGKPVVLHTGSYTCDRYQEREPQIAKFAKRFGDDVHTVLVYTIEAHPKTDPSPYRPRNWTRPFSDRDEARTWEERAKNSRDLELSDKVTVLIDEMDNAFWCTYGPCPNCSFLVAPDGKLEAVHSWHDPKTMAQSTRALLDRLAAAPER